MRSTATDLSMASMSLNWYMNNFPLTSNSVINSSLTFAADVSSHEVQVTQVNDLPISELVLRTEMPNQVINGMKLVKGNVELQVMF
jgi:hypothetical protein